MKVNREELLKALEYVSPGLVAKETVEQSSCVVFSNGRVWTFNDELFCSFPIEIGITGAVRAKPLIASLRKWTEETITVTATESEFIINGNKCKAGIYMEEEILLPIDSVTLPKKWKKLNTNFSEAISMVKGCAEKNEGNFYITCLHLHPDYIEATNNHQFGRYNLENKFKTPHLVKRDSIQHIISMDMIGFAEAEKWLHFKNKAGLILSCRQWDAEEFPDTSALTKFTGESLAFPKNLGESVGRAEIFSKENAADNEVLVQWQKNRMRITGKGLDGRFVKEHKAAYDGTPIEFKIDPELLIELSDKYETCEVSDRVLKIEVGNFLYVSAIKPRNE